MEYLEGQPLAELIAAGPVELKRRWKIAVVRGGGARSGALPRHRASRHHAREHLRHRGGRAKILDFGLAEMTRRGAASGDDCAGRGAAISEDTLADPAAIEGTTDYMSPEQVSGRALTRGPTCIRWAWCSTKCSSGRRPFVADSTRRRSRRLSKSSRPRSRNFAAAFRGGSNEWCCVACRRGRRTAIPRPRVAPRTGHHRASKREGRVAPSRRDRRAGAAARFRGIRGADLLRASRSRWVDTEALPAAALMTETIARSRHSR